MQSDAAVLRLGALPDSAQSNAWGHIAYLSAALLAFLPGTAHAVASVTDCFFITARAIAVVPPDWTGVAARGRNHRRIACPTRPIKPHRIICEVCRSRDAGNGGPLEDSLLPRFIC